VDDESSAYGMALSAQRLNDRAGFSAIISQWRNRSRRIADLAAGTNRGRRSPAAQPATIQPEGIVPAAPLRQNSPPRATTEARAFHAKNPLQARQVPVRSGSTRNCTMTRNPSNLSADAALALGWCLMEINRPLEAVAAFDQAIRKGSDHTREEAAYGKTLAYLRKDLTSQAAIAAAEAPQTSARRTELSATILAQRAVAAYRDGRYAEAILALGERGRIVPEQNDLMLIKGWSYLKLGRYNDAEKIFRAVQRTGYSEEANVGLNAVLENTRPSRYQ
jgi:tetratricopeptide (TPR) repeat protein